MSAKKSIENSPTIILIHGAVVMQKIYSHLNLTYENYNIIAVKAQLHCLTIVVLGISLSRSDGTFDSKLEDAWGAVILLEKSLDYLVEKYKLNKKISVYWDLVKDQYSTGHLLTTE